MSLYVCDLITLQCQASSCILLYINWFFHNTIHMRLNHNPEENDINENKPNMMNHGKMLTTSVREG